MAEGPGCVGHVESGAPQAVQRGDRVRREDGGAAAAEGPGQLGVRADNGDPAEPGARQRKHALVSGQHERGRRGGAQVTRDLRRAVRCERGCGGPIGKRADPAGQPEDPEHLIVDQRLVNLAVGHGGEQGVAPGTEPARGPRHGQVEGGPGGGHGRAGGRPVRHHQAVEVPVTVQDVTQQRAFGQGRAVDAVVGSHHRPHAGLADDRLERGQVQLPQRPLVDPHIHREPLRLGVVADEVLDASPDAGALEPVHVGDADPGGEQRILGEALEVPAAVGGPVQVHGGGEQHVDALAPAFVREQPADRLDAVAVPGGGQRRRRRHVGGRVALVPGLAADPGRAVGGHEPAQPGAGCGVQCPEVRAGQQLDLLRQGKTGDPPPQLVLGQDRGHVLFAGHGVGRLTRDASAARCASGVPKAIESAFARFRYRCAGCSQVKPMPPCICTHSWAASTATSEQ